MERYCPSCYAVIDEISSKCPVCGVGIKGKAKSKKEFNKAVIIVPIIVVILVSASLFAVILTRTLEDVDLRAIQIDDDFGDWNEVTSNTDSADLPFFNPNIDIVDFRIDGRDSYLSFYLQVNGDMLAGEPLGEGHVDTAYIFIDTDQSPDTGYFINGIGADYMLEIYGRDEVVLGSSYYSYTSAEQDWNHWEEVGTVDAAVSGSDLETQISFRSLFMDEHDEVDVMFYMQSWDGFEDFSDYIVSNEDGILIVTQKGASQATISGTTNKVLELEVSAENVQITLTEFRLKRLGSGTDGDIGAVRLMDGGSTIGLPTTLNGAYANLQTNLVLNPGTSRSLHVEVDVRDSAPTGNSIGFSILSNSDVTIDQGAVTLERDVPDSGLYDAGYLFEIPENITIDGAFADWEGKTVRNDTSNDVVQDNLDILRYGLSNTDDGPAFYLSVDGEIGGGREVPFWNGISEANPNWEDDTSNTGEDMIRVFIDTVPGTGFQVPGTNVLADFMIEIRGRHNTVLSSRLFDWFGHDSEDWNWINLGSVNVAIDSTQMEIGIQWQDIGVDPTNDTFEVFFSVTNWIEENIDFSNSEGAIMGPTR